MKHNKTTILAIVCAIALAVPFQTNAQSNPYQDKSDAWWSALEQQLTESLDADVDQVQDETLQHIIFFASNYSENIDLSEVTPKLLDVYVNESNDARRTMAIVALHAIGNDLSMRRLAELAENEPAGSIRNITMAVLADYFSS